MKLELTKDEMEAKTDALLDTVLVSIDQCQEYEDMAEVTVPEHYGTESTAVDVEGVGKCSLGMFTTPRYDIPADRLLMLEWEGELSELKANALLVSLVDLLMEKAEILTSCMKEKGVRIASRVYANVNQQPGVTAVSFYCYGLVPVVHGTLRGGPAYSKG